MIRALKDQNRPEAVFTVHGGMILEGDDILMATMSLTAAKVRCTSLPNCCGFYSEDWPTDNSGFIEGHSEAEQAGNGGGNGEGAWNHDMLWCLVVRFLAAEVDVHFKTTWRPCPASRQGQRGGPVAYQKERASPLFTRRRGYALDGTDLFVSEMTIEGAKRFCAELQDCEGFTFKGSERVDGTTLIHFKSRSRLMLDSTGMSTCYVFETESRSHALPADGATFFQLITDGKEEVDLLEEVEVAKAATPEPSRIPSGPLVEGPR